jgi:UDPglucose 6-dehydrogenase
MISTASECGYDFLLLKAVEEVNRLQKEVLADKLITALGTSGQPQPLAGKTIACWGLSFKPRTDDMREAPSITIIERLLDAGATVRAHDPEAIEEAKKIFGNRIEFNQNQYEILNGADALTVITDWNEYRNPDFEKIKAALKNLLIVDGRNLYKPGRLANAGFSYIPLGRCGSGISAEGR